MSLITRWWLAVPHESWATSAPRAYAALLRMQLSRSRKPSIHARTGFGHLMQCYNLKESDGTEYEEISYTRFISMLWFRQDSRWVRNIYSRMLRCVEK